MKTRHKKLIYNITRKRITRKRITRKRITRKRMSDSDSLDSIFYYPIEYILDNSKLVLGAGITKSTKTIQRTIQRTDTDRFLNKLIALGWRPEYIQTTFQNMNDKLIQGWPENLLIESIFKEIINQQGFQDSLDASFINIGLQEEIANQLSNILYPLLESSYTNEQILDAGIEYLLGNYAPISLTTTTYPIRPNRINSWFKHKNDISKEISIYNIPINETTTDLEEAINIALRILPHNDSKQYYFHSTSWRSSFNIMKYINRQRGRTCLDFGIYPGFYLSKTLTESIDWGLKNSIRWYKEVAIMIFAIPNIKPKYIKYKDLKGDEWLQVTKEARECKQKENEINSIRKYDLLYGDMVYNVNEVKEGISLPRPHNPPKKQLVGRSDKAEKFLYKCLVGCIYFQKYT
jgi:hypothetical protein